MDGVLVLPAAADVVSYSRATGGLSRLRRRTVGSQMRPRIVGGAGVGRACDSPPGQSMAVDMRRWTTAHYLLVASASHPVVVGEV